jgi:DNA-binding helix-hairpin-helix protein with protein kinase domain
MTTQSYIVGGQKLNLGSRIGKGGEGEVYAVSGIENLAAKIYTVNGLQEREAKIRAMVAAGLAQTTSLIAYPIDYVRTTHGTFAGFTMKLVSKHKSLHELYSPGARKATFPKADYRFLVRAAANVSRAIASAHASNCVIGDINHSGILISDQATVALIDADSFQVSDGNRQHLCRVGVPEYTPPELQGKRLDVLRTPNHDAFGLALVCFQLLFMGRHPFAGRSSSGYMPFERAIGEYRFAYSRARSGSVGMTPPPAAPTLADFPSAIAAAFEQAFGPSGTTTRPSARQWISLLEELERDLRACSKNPLHSYSSHARECPWCRMENALSIPLFVSPNSSFSAGPAFRSTLADWKAIWAAIEALVIPGPAPSMPQLPQLTLRAAQQHSPPAFGISKYKGVGVGIIAVSLALLAALPEAALFWIIGAFVGASQFFRSPPPSKDELIKASLLTSAERLERRWENALASWRNSLRDDEFRNERAKLANIKAEIEKLLAGEQGRINAAIQQSEQRNRAYQLNTYLDRFQIRQATITGIGPARLAVLASYGIESAADISLASLLKVPGFGRSNAAPLLAWRQSLEGNFRYVLSGVSGGSAVQAVKNETATQLSALSAQLGSGLDRLRTICTEITNRRQNLPPEIRSLHQEREQLKVDLRAFGLSYPVSNTSSGHTQSSSTSSPRGIIQPSGNSCPLCGSAVVLRTAKRGFRRGSKFYGCSRYPICRGTRPGP